MDLRLAVLADAANVTSDGKLNVTGIFNRLRTTKLPAQHPLLVAVLQIAIGAADFGRDAQTGLRIVAPDGETTDPFTMTHKLPRGRPGEPALWNVIFRLPNLRLAKAGAYEFHVLVDRATVATIPLTVTKVEAKGSPLSQPPAPPKDDAP